MTIRLFEPENISDILFHNVSNVTSSPKSYFDIFSTSSIYEQIYIFVYTLTLLYILKLLFKLGLPSLCFDQNHYPETNTNEFYLGTRLLGFGLLYNLSIVSRTFSIDLIIQNEEGVLYQG